MFSVHGPPTEALPPMKTENKTARLTLLLDPRKKAMFEEICAAQDLTPSQVVRQLIREYIIEHAGSRPLPAWLLAASGARARASRR
jgi:Ribbon-helix-helix protein